MTENEQRAFADAMLDESATSTADDERRRRELSATSAGVLITPRDLGDGRVQIGSAIVQSYPLPGNPEYDGWAGRGYDGYDRNGALGADGNVYSDAEGDL